VGEKEKISQKKRGGRREITAWSAHPHGQRKRKKRGEGERRGYQASPREGQGGGKEKQLWDFLLASEKKRVQGKKEKGREASVFLS